MFLIFNLEGCPFCKKAISALEARSLKYKLYNVTDKELAKSLILHLLVLSSFLEDLDKKKYILGIQTDRKEMSSQIIEKAKEKKGRITFPQVFIVSETDINLICSDQYILNENIMYVGDSSQLTEKLKIY